ncbi:unnamed protein product [Tuber aestivum]|uniref:Uncharacterized protein n=1 Tax=Tuber aestivum TaxID=59557 RepID=A0A292PZA4_9PEZI|nr:unnamed protein product [Tuber aestivum]
MPKSRAIPPLYHCAVYQSLDNNTSPQEITGVGFLYPIDCGGPPEKQEENQNRRLSQEVGEAGWTISVGMAEKSVSWKEDKTPMSGVSKKVRVEKRKLGGNAAAQQAMG